MIKAHRRRTAIVGLSVGASLLALSGCKVFVKEEPPPCPRVSILADAAKLVQFRPGPGRDITDIAYKVQVVNYAGSCFYDKEYHVMTVDLQVGFDAQRGAALSEDSQEIRYFISVPTFFPQPDAKEIFPLTLKFSKNAASLHVTDQDAKISIPVKSVKELERYEVFIGLQLDEAQLDYNRHHVSP
jgi:hypothetical protein